MACIITTAWFFCREHRYLLWAAAAGTCVGIAMAWQIVFPPAVFPQGLMGTSVLYVMGVTSMAQAVALRFGQRVSWPLVVVLGTLFMVQVSRFVYVQDHVVLRVITLATVLSLILMHVLPRILRAPAAHRMDRILKWAYLALVVFVVSRPLWLLLTWGMDFTPMAFNHSLMWLVSLLGTLVAGLPQAILLLLGAMTDSIKRLKHERDRDGLTGLLNRRALLEMAESQRKAEHSTTSLVLCDIDHFKPINDRWGHSVGDQVLCGVAEALSAHVRHGDVVARLGGEEFVIVLHGAPMDIALKVVERIRLHLSEMPIAMSNGKQVQVTASFGAVQLRADEPIAQAIDRADQLMYGAKQAGRNCVHWEQITPPIITLEAQAA